MATRQITLPITGMTCANCAATIERNLKKLPGLASAAVNLASERASVEYDPQALSPGHCELTGEPEFRSNLDDDATGLHSCS